MPDLVLLANLLVDKRDWLRKKAILTVDEDLSRMDQESLGELVRLLRERVKSADEPVATDVKTLIEVFESFLLKGRREPAKR